MANYQQFETPQNPLAGNSKGIIVGVIIFISLILVIVFWSKMTVTINSGEAGVLFETLGDGVKTDQTFGEGFHFIAPWNKMYVYEVRQTETSEKMSVLSQNGLEITVDVSLWLQPDYETLPLLHKEKGQDYIGRVVKPGIRSATRSVIGRYTPEEIYSSKRDQIQTEIYEETKKLITDQYIQLNRVLVRDITLPPTIKTAIEKKLRQEQESLEYEFKITKAKQEAERQRIDAEGKAAANKILSASLTDKILKEKGIEATIRLAESPNAKVIVVGGGKSGLPIILGNN